MDLNVEREEEVFDSLKEEEEEIIDVVNDDEVNEALK